MTREEQIIAEAKKYYNDSINCHNAFLHGVEWADEHPVNVWHDASEEPQGYNRPFLCQDTGGGFWVENMFVVLRTYNTWNEYVKIEMVDKWAYIEDLSPKGDK